MKHETLTSSIYIISYTLSQHTFTCKYNSQGDGAVYVELLMFTAILRPLNWSDPLGLMIKRFAVYQPTGKTDVLLKTIISLPFLIAGTLPTDNLAVLVTLMKQPFLVEFKANVQRNLIAPNTFGSSEAQASNICTSVVSMEMNKIVFHQETHVAADCCTVTHVSVTCIGNPHQHAH